MKTVDGRKRADKKNGEQKEKRQRIKRKTKRKGMEPGPRPGQSFKVRIRRAERK